MIHKAHSPKHKFLQVDMISCSLGLPPCLWFARGSCSNHPAFKLHHRKTQAIKGSLTLTNPPAAFPNASPPWAQLAVQVAVQLGLPELLELLVQLGLGQLAPHKLHRPWSNPKLFLAPKTM